MQAIISPLDPESSERVIGLWQTLKMTCGLQEILRLPLPHLTWDAVDGYENPSIGRNLAELAAAQPVLEIQTNGLGLFGGPQPVLYLPVVCNPALSDLRLRILAVSAIDPQGRSANYSPENWVPHITLAHTDADLPGVQCAIASLLPDPLIWKVRLLELQLVDFEPGSHAVIRSRFVFGARSG